MAWTERYVSVAGGGNHDGTTEADAWTMAEAIAAPYAVGQRINVKAGTYANTTTTLTFAVAGTTTQPIWWRGYNTAIGDLDSSHSLALPAITFTTGVFDCTGAYHIFTNLNISGAQTTAAQVRLRTGTHRWVDRCRIECTSANANGRAVTLVGEDVVSRSWLKASASADVMQIATNGGTSLGNAIIGGADGISFENSINACAAFNTLRGQAANAIIYNQAGRIWLIGNSIEAPGSDGVDLITTIPSLMVIANNIFSDPTAFGIVNAVGTDSGNIIRMHNLFYSTGSGDESGFADWPAFGNQVDVSSPHTSSTDFTIVDGSNAIANGVPMGFENESYTSYLDIGAVQRVEPSASGGLLRNPGTNGGLL